MLWKPPSTAPDSVEQRSAGSQGGRTHPSSHTVGDGTAPPSGASVEIGSTGTGPADTVHAPLVARWEPDHTLYVAEDRRPDRPAVDQLAPLRAVGRGRVDPHRASSLLAAVVRDGRVHRHAAPSRIHRRVHPRRIPGRRRSDARRPGVDLRGRPELTAQTQGALRYS